MPQGDVETYHQDGAWKNRVEGGELSESGSWNRKEDAVAAGRELARSRGVEHIIRDLDGQIGERNSYGHDPRNIKG